MTRSTAKAKDYVYVLEISVNKYREIFLELITKLDFVS